MKYILLLFALISISQTVLANAQCFELFKSSEEIIAEKAPAALDAAIARTADQTPVFEMSDAQLAAVSSVIAKELGMRTNEVSPKELRHAMFKERRSLDDSIGSRLDFFGFETNQAVREMRDRRKNFLANLTKGDSYKAALVYARVFEVYYVTISRIITYMDAPAATRDQQLLSSTSKDLLIGLVQGREFRDIRRKIKRVYQRDPNPSAGEIMSIYDMIFSRVSNEVRYVEWSISAAEKASEEGSTMRKDVNYIRERLDPSGLKESYGIETLPLAQISRSEVSKALEIGRPQIRIYWLRHVLSKQQWKNIKLVGRTLIWFDRVQNAISHLHPYIRGPLMFLMRTDYNMFMLSKFVDSLESVLLAPKESRMQVFLAEIARIGINGQKKEVTQFLETFARLAPDSASWRGLKVDLTRTIHEHESTVNPNQVSLKAPEGLDIKDYDPTKTAFQAATERNVLRQMLLAEMAIEQRGFMSISDRPTPFTYLVGAVTLTSGAIVVWRWDDFVALKGAILTTFGAG